MASRLPACMGLILLLLLLFLSRGSAVDREPLSDFKICANEECRDVMYRVKAIRDYEAQDCRFVSFSKDDDVYVYYRLTGQREDLWLGMVGNKVGYFPKDVVEVQHNYSKEEITLPTMDTDFSCSNEETFISESAEYPDSKTPTDLNEDSLAIDLEDGSEHTPPAFQLASPNEESNDETVPDFSDNNEVDLTSSNNGGEHFSVPYDNNSTIYNEPGDSKVAAHTEVEGGESGEIVVEYKSSVMPDIKHPIDTEEVDAFVLETEKSIPSKETVKVVKAEEQNSSLNEDLEILHGSEIMEHNKERVTIKKHITYEQMMGSNLQKDDNFIDTVSKDAAEEQSHGTSTSSDIETKNNNELENADIYKPHDSELESENGMEGSSFYASSFLAKLNLSSPHYTEQNKDLALLKAHIREEMLSQLTELLGLEGVIALETSLWGMDEELQHTESVLGHDVQREKLLDSVVAEFRSHILWWFRKVVDTRVRLSPLNPEEIHKDTFYFLSDVQEIIASLRRKYSTDVIEPEDLQNERGSSSRLTPGAGVKFLAKGAKKTGCRKSGIAAARVPEMIQKFDSFILNITAALRRPLQPFLMAITSWKPELSQSIVNYYGLPLDVSVLLLLFAFILCLVFFCRICLVIRNRISLQREAALVVQVKNIINEKNMLICQVVDTKVKLTEVETTMEETKGKLENSNDNSVALKSACKRMEEELLQLTQVGETLMEDLAAVRQEGKRHKQKLYQTKRNMEMLEATKALLKAQLKQLLPRMDASHAAEEKLQTELQAAQRTHQQLRDSTEQTDREKENCKAQSAELQEKLEQKKQYREEMLATLACKEEELEVMTNFLNEIRQFTLPSEQRGERRVVENGELSDSHSHERKPKLRDLLDVEKLQATLEVTEEEIADLQTRYSIQLEENNKLQDVIQERENKNAELLSESSHMKNELDYCRKKLDIVKQMYQEKESTLQKKIFVEQQARDLLETSPAQMDERVQQAMEEASTNKKQVQTLRQELEKVESEFREQMAEFEKKVYENWLKTRSVERDLKASRQEVGNLRQRMAELEYNMDLAEAQEMPPQNHGMPRSSSTPQGLAVGGSSLGGTPFTVSPVSIPPSPPRLTDEPRRAPSAPLGYRGLPGYGPERTPLNYDKRFPSPHPGFEPGNELPSSESNNFQHHLINDGNESLNKVTNDEVDGKEVPEVLSSRTSTTSPLRWGLPPRDHYNHGPGQGQHFEPGLHRPQFPPPDLLQSREAHHYYRPQPMFHPFAPHPARIPPRDFPPHGEMYSSLPPLMNPMAGPPPPRGSYNMMPLLRHFGPPPYLSSGPPVRLYGPPPPRGPYGLPAHLEPPQRRQIPPGLHPSDDVGIPLVRDDENVHPVSSAGSDSSRP